MSDETLLDVPDLSAPRALVVLGPEAVLMSDTGEIDTLSLPLARQQAGLTPVLVCHAPLTLHRLGMEALATLDLLELFAFVHPAQFCVPTPRGLAEARYNFHDTELSPIVQRAYHALAIDEHRADHNATLWTSPAVSGQIIEQRWFAGAHGDLGGIYPDRDLGNISLEWILRSSIGNGLAIAPRSMPANGNALSPLHDSFSESFVGLRKWIHSRFYRPVMQTGTSTEVLDGSDPHTLAREALLQAEERRPQQLTDISLVRHLARTE